MVFCKDFIKNKRGRNMMKNCTSAIWSNYLKYIYMKNIRLLFAGLLLLAFAGCNSSDDEDTQGGYEKGNSVRFTSAISPIGQTKTADDTWTNGDRIGVYMLKNGTNQVVNDARNVNYTSDTSGNLTASGDGISYPVGINVDFVAYYPYQSNLDKFTYVVNVADQSKPESIDLIYSNNAVSASDTDAAINLQFTHQLTKVVFNIAAEQGLTANNLKNLTVNIKDMNTQAGFNLASGRIDNAKQVAPVEALTSADGTLSQAIVIPAANTTFTLQFVMSNGGTFEWTTPVPVTLESGKINTFDATMGTSSIEVSQGDIVDWTGANDAPIIGEGTGSGSTVNTTYKVGDVYPHEGTALGIVFEISNNGKSGKVVSLVESSGRWGAWPKDENGDAIVGIRDADNGLQGTRSIIKIRSGAGNFAGDYTIFKWVYETMNENVWDGEWYVPSKNELKSLYAAFSGLTYADIEISWTDGNAMPGFDSQTYKDARTVFNLKMTTAGGSILNDTGRYWTSTEFDANKAWVIRFSTSVLDYSLDKYNTWIWVRPILAF
jgi:hypothetical protein